VGPAGVPPADRYFATPGNMPGVPTAKMAVLHCTQSQMERASVSAPHVLMVLQEKSKFLRNLLPNFMQYVSE
jgi:hypothetical protein